VPARHRAKRNETSRPRRTRRGRDVSLSPQPLPGLRYVSDEMPGIRRRRAGSGFTYFNSTGKRITETKELERIRSLAVPPAWNDVWICPDPHGHIQATGRDARNRKQYRYHPRWREVRDESKFDRMLAFGAALPAVRARINAGLRLPGMPREKVLAAVVSLLEATLIRVGNEEYARANHSYGLTTLRNQHARVEASEVLFRFKAKSGIRRRVSLKDPRLARIVRRCQDLPGQALFIYLDEDDEPHAIDSSSVNDYLREIGGVEFTAKDFRTWAGTKVGAMALLEQGPYQSETEGKRKMVHAMETVAEVLGNTPAIARKSYVHPAVIDAYFDGSLFEVLEHPTRAMPRGWKTLDLEEQLIMDFLSRREKAVERKAS
jgi:DNA topoisomerase I